MTTSASARVRPLDDRFAKVVALMHSTQHKGERDAARSKATALAAAAGMTLDQALATLAPPPAAKPRSFFDGFDDLMEAKEPGWKARQAAQRQAKHHAWQVRRAAILARYGSTDAATIPCRRERLILAAVAPWREVSPCGRWTRTLDGWSGSFLDFKNASAHVLDAIRGAYPLPSTFTEAKVECEYWTARNDELDDVFAEEGAPAGDYVLDMAAMIRARLVERLARYDLPTTTLADLHGRMAMWRDDESGVDHEAEDAMFRDLTAMVEAERPAGGPEVEAAPPRADKAAASVHVGGRIAALIREHADWSDRRLARAAGCSPTTIGKVRRAIGAGCAKRSAHRGGQTYAFTVGARP